MTRSNEQQPIIRFHQVKKQISKLIKVIGVGGAGTNAVNYMFEKDPLSQVEYVVCNTDIQALKASPVPRKIQIGKNVTKGLGAGSNPQIGQQAVTEDMDEIRDILSKNTKMVFITAGLGGGTGTGAAPEIAKVASELGLLTVAVVTMPFEYEGERRLKQAREGLEKLKPHVDSLIIINNEKIIEVYGDLGWKKAFAKSDEVLSNAVRSVTKVITDNYEINVDFNDVEAVLKRSGRALIATAEAGGPNRADEVVEKVLDSPLLNDNHIIGAKDLLLLILSGNDEITVNEISRINKALKKATDNPKLNIIQGLGEDPSLGDKISITIIATGFKEKALGQSGAEEDEKDVIVVAPANGPVTISLDEENTIRPVEEDEEDTSSTPVGQETAAPGDEEDELSKEWLLFEQEQQIRESSGETLAVNDKSSGPEIPAPAPRQMEPENGENSPIYEALDEKERPVQPSLFDQITEDAQAPSRLTENGEQPAPEHQAREEITEAILSETPQPAETEPVSEMQTDHPTVAEESMNDTETEPDTPANGIEAEEVIIVDETLELDGDEQMLVNRHPGSDLPGPAQRPDQPTAPYRTAHKVSGDEKMREKQRLRTYMHRFTKTFEGPVIPAANREAARLNLGTNKPQWNNDDSYINQKFD